MPKLIKAFQYGFVILVVLGVAYLMGVQSMLVNLARAAGLVFSPTSCYTAVATTTLSYFTAPGTGTTTVTCPMGNDGADTAVLAVQINASSTAFTADIFVEESMDGQDYYPITPSQSASSTNPFRMDTRAFARLNFSTSTIGAVGPGASLNGVGVNGTQNRNNYTIDVPVRMKYVRAHLGVASTTTTGQPMNGGVWMQIIPKVQL